MALTASRGLRARERDRQDVVHETRIEQAGFCHSCIEIAEQESVDPSKIPPLGAPKPSPLRPNAQKFLIDDSVN